MSFLLPIAWGLAGLGLPVIAFYLLKTRQRRRNVSSLLFWEVLKPRMENHPLWRKLRKWLSLLIQLLMLLLLIAALARPAFDWETRAPRRVVAVLDPSASMQAGNPEASRWSTAVEALRAEISRMRIQDEMTILTVETPPRILSGWTGSRRVLHEAVDLALPVPTGTDPRSAMELAADLTGLREGAVLGVFSDSVWPEGRWKAPVVSTTFRGLGIADAGNAGFILLAVRRSPVAPGDWQMDAEIVSTKPFSGTVEVFRNGEPMDRILIECGPDKPWKKSWTGSSQDGAVFEAKLQGEGVDLLASDNSASCELMPLATLDVLVAGPPDPYVDAALSSIPLVNFWMEKSLPEQIPPGTDLVITHGSVVPSTPLEVPTVLINPQSSGFWGERGQETDAGPLSSAETKSALTLHAGLGNVLVDRSSAWKPAPGAEVLAASLSSPLIFGNWDRNPRWLVVGFDLKDSDLPLRTAFPVFLGNLLQALRDGGELEKAAAILPGVTESRLVPLVTEAGSEESRAAPGLSLPGWWLVLLLALLILVAEWFTYTRRITD